MFEIEKRVHDLAMLYVKFAVEKELDENPDFLSDTTNLFILYSDACEEIKSHFLAKDV